MRMFVSDAAPEPRPEGSDGVPQLNSGGCPEQRGGNARATRGEGKVVYPLERGESGRERHDVRLES